MKFKIFTIALSIIALGIIIIFFVQNNRSKNTTVPIVETPSMEQESAISVEVGQLNDVLADFIPQENEGTFRNFVTDISKTSVDLDLILSGGPAKDGIPALFDPDFVSLSDSKVNDDVQGLLVDINGDKRFYPYTILVWHEIVNDTVGGEPIAVTFCPLCGSGIVFDRRIGDTVLDLGVSGFLFESNMVFYDKQTESLWSQARGTAIVGHFLDTKLDIVQTNLTTMENVKMNHPGARVLSTKTGHARTYGFNPYGGYEDNDNFFFPISVNDNRFPAKELFYVIPLEDKSIAIRINEVATDTSYNISFKERTLSLRESGDTITVLDGATSLPGYYEMWFSWATHHQDDGVVWQP